MGTAPHQPMTMTDWFDPYDQTHISAYRHAERTGHLPEGFLPDTVELDNMWQVTVLAKMGSEWMKAMEHGVIRTWHANI